jgi:hypothetical protein
MRRNRNPAQNPAVCVHLESGSNVVILHGEARELGEKDESWPNAWRPPPTRSTAMGRKPKITWPAGRSP